MWDVIFEKYVLFLLIFARMAGMILFNPIFGKRNVPVIIKMGLALAVSVIILPTLTDVSVNIGNTFEYLFIIAKELFIGFTVGFILQVFLSVPLTAGEIIDQQLGVSMSRIYDPLSNIPMPLTGTIYNYLFILLFFCSNGHLTLIALITESYRFLPLGAGLLNLNAAGTIVYMFGDILVLIVKLALPIVAIEVITEMGMGILMKTVPQINVFVVGLQLKLFVGLAVIVLLIPSVSVFLDNTMNTMFKSMEDVLTQMAG